MLFVVHFLSLTEMSGNYVEYRRSWEAETCSPNAFIRLILWAYKSYCDGLKQIPNLDSVSFS
jgi:hypothetical protein